MEETAFPIPEPVIWAEAEKICDRYKIEPGKVRDLLVAEFSARPRLLEKLSGLTPEEITRLSEFRSAVKAAKKKVYYLLRRYHQVPEDESLLRLELDALIRKNAGPEKYEPLLSGLLDVHVSTRERRPYYEEFYDTLSDCFGDSKAILDLGCGIHPLSFPFDRFSPSVYMALDRDRDALAILSRYAEVVSRTRLTVLEWDLLKSSWKDLDLPSPEGFDLAVFLKLVPVLERREKGIITRLAKVPARRILVTGNMEAMTRKQSVFRRERKIIEGFIRETGKSISKSFFIGKEFGYILED